MLLMENIILNKLSEYTIMVETDSKEIEDFIKSVTEGINKGLENSGFHIHNEDIITLEISIISIKEVGGKINICIADTNGKYDRENVTKISIPIRKKSLVYVK